MKRSRSGPPTASLALLLLLPIAAAAQQSAPRSAGGEPSRPVAEARAAAGTVAIDGRLDEAAWRAAPAVTGFTQVDPEEGRPVSQPTEARILYDAEALYIGVRLHDSGEVRTRLGRRDMALSDSDWFGVVIDSYHDHRTGFVFDVNPSGVQRDAVKSITGGGDEVDDNSWDAVWQVATSVDEGGWTAEYRIPFSQLRFNESESPVWGIQLERVIGRNKEYAVFSFTPKSERGGIATYGHLVGLRDLEPGARLELLPYVVGRGEYVDPGPNPYRTDSELAGSAGLDVLYRITPELTLNGSVNPDFGQVELDPAVINLSVYETFFEEKRPFFIEGSEIFDFGRNTSGGRLFYSRRIGRAPQLGAPTLEADAPDVTNILAAAKLSGKTRSGWSLGVIEAVTARETARFRTADGLDDELTVEPLTNYFVGRARRDFSPTTSLGGMLTSVRRERGGDAAAALLPGSAWAGGVDFRHEWDDRAWLLQASATFSRVAGEPASLMRVQTAGNHFFQRPDAHHLELDPAATSLAGYSVGVALDRQAGEHWRGSVAVAATHPGFEVNDLGFQMRTDRRDANLSVTYLENEPGEFLRNYNVTGRVRYEHNFDWQRISNWWTLQADFRTLGFWGGTARFTYSFPSLDDRFTRGGPLVERPANWSATGHLRSDPREPVTFRGGFSFGGDAYDGWSAGVNGEVTVKTSPRWSLTVGPSFDRTYASAQYVATVADPTAIETFGARYLAAPLDQTTLSLDTRLNVTFAPRLTLEVFAQPFIASGDYREVGALAAPRGYTFEPWHGEEPNLDFNYRSLRGNAVLRWEWRPGSTVYVAWQQMRSHRATGVGDFDFGRDRAALFDAEPDDILMVKIDYWFTS